MSKKLESVLLFLSRMAGVADECGYLVFDVNDRLVSELQVPEDWPVPAVWGPASFVWGIGDAGSSAISNWVWLRDDGHVFWWCTECGQYEGDGQFSAGQRVESPSLEAYAEEMKESYLA